MRVVVRGRNEFVHDLDVARVPGGSKVSALHRVEQGALGFVIVGAVLWVPSGGVQVQILVVMVGVLALEARRPSLRMRVQRAGVLSSGRSCRSCMSVSSAWARSRGNRARSTQNGPAHEDTRVLAD